PRPHHLLTIRPPGPRRHLRPARRARCDERWAELAPGRPSLDAQHLDQAIPAGMTPPEMARHVGVPLPDFLGRQPRQQIHLLLDGTAAEERAHALGAGRRFARGELVEEAQEGPAVGAATDVFLGFPTLVLRRCRVPGPTPWGAEQDRHALTVIHGHISMTTGGPRLWRGATCGASFLVPEGDTQRPADALQLPRHAVAGQVLPERDVFLGHILDELHAGDVQLLGTPRHDLETLAIGGHLLRGGAIHGQP